MAHPVSMVQILSRYYHVEQRMLWQLRYIYNYFYISLHMSLQDIVNEESIEVFLPFKSGRYRGINCPCVSQID